MKMSVITRRATSVRRPLVVRAEQGEPGGVQVVLRIAAEAGDVDQ